MATLSGLLSRLLRDRTLSFARVFLAALASLAASAGCGDTMADPIVRVAQSSGGADGSAGRGNGDSDLCSPCGSRSDCNEMESCVGFSRNGNRFCSHACGDGNGRCPSGFVCGDAYNASAPQCMPESGSCNQVVP